MTTLTIRLRPRTQTVTDGHRLVLRLGDTITTIAPFDELAEQLLHHLVAGVGDDALVADMTEAFGADGRDRTEEILATLTGLGFMEHVEVPADIHPADLARFSRLVDFFSQFEDSGTDRYDYLRKLIGARVAVLGTGGMGSWITYNLMCMGVGNLRLIDGDVVEASNLNRSILYSEEDIGRPKVEAARDAVLRFAPRTNVEIHHRYIDGDGPLAELLDGVDLLVGCADKPAWLIREWVARAGQAAGVPTFNVSGGRVGPLYVPGKTSCQMCDWAALVDRNPRLPRLVELNRRLPRGNSGSLTALAMGAAAPAVFDIFRFLSGYAPPRSFNAVLEIEETGNTPVPRPPHPDCVICAGEVSDAGGELSAPAGLVAS
ncbi:HesA/MoeB/ThiF family protein [Cryptosporangium sp. NPDC051539]|uniref:HesA/MoeB/ThiF family protein n=1 Tax=Cryptosporangium sp. NPDC051539 TaxID=3363962 RepID=UPI003798D62F